MTRHAFALLIAGFFLAAPALAAQAVGMRFPTVSGRNLEGRELTLPDDFGERTVVVVAFKQRQQRDVDSWVPELNARRAADPGLEVYEIPTLGSGWTPLRWWIDGGMARGIKSQAVRESTVTIYINKTPFKDALGITSEEQIQLLVLDAQGRVSYRTTGRATPSGIEALRRALSAATPRSTPAP